MSIPTSSPKTMPAPAPSRRCAATSLPGCPSSCSAGWPSTPSNPANREAAVKLPAGRVEGFLRRPDPETRAVLLYGPDTGLARERADALARSICPDLRDPFRVADLAASALAGDPARLADEAAQIGLMGGRRVVRVREAGGALASLFARVLPDAVGAPGGGDTPVLVEAGDLPARSALRPA